MDVGPSEKTEERSDDHGIIQAKLTSANAPLSLAVLTYERGNQSSPKSSSCRALACFVSASSHLEVKYFTAVVWTGSGTRERELNRRTPNGNRTGAELVSSETDPAKPFEG